MSASHTTLTVGIERTGRLDTLLSTGARPVYIKAWVVTCSCGTKTEGHASRTGAVGAQRVHRNDARILASMGVLA